MVKRKLKRDSDIFSFACSRHSVEHLEKCKQVIEKLIAYKRLDTLHTRYISGIKKALSNNKEKKCYFDFKFESTVTGRLSCSRYSAGKKKPKGVSFHTLPREEEFNIRSIFVAPQGYDFITADMKTMELRLLAELAGESKMVEAFNNGLDIHLLTGRQIYGRDDITKEERNVGKTVNFTIAYAGTEFTIAERNKISIDLATKIKDKFYGVYPKIFDYQQQCEYKIRKFGFIDTIFERRRHLPNVYSPSKKISEEAIRQGINFTIQSPSSDILLGSAIGLATKLKIFNLTAWLVATVHDSIELVSLKPQSDQVIEILYDQMVNYPYLKEHFGMGFNVPFEIEVSKGPSFGEGNQVHFTKEGKLHV